MGTVETLIVFSALMALIAVVTIGIDWIGKPLKTDVFIPRIYRFDDEQLPIDAYGNTQFLSQPDGEYAGQDPSYGLQPHMQPPPMVVAHAPFRDPTIAISSAPPHTPSTRPPIAPPASASAFSDSLTPTEEPRSTIAGTTPPSSDQVSPSTSWHPGMALDASSDGRKPSLATKAERFWMSTASELATTHRSATHFDDANAGRMSSGKAPRRLNPRTGRTEAMQLTGLRQASDPSHVRMRWPDDSVDPWAGS